jgi:serine/threonine-protein kinase
MSEAHDPNRTVDIPTAPADSLDAGLAAGFGRPANAPGSALSGLRDRLGDLRPILLQEAQGESGHVVKPKSDAMPPPEQTGDRYQLQGEIARGGMGAVLRGRDVDLGRDLAVKVLLEKYVNRPDVARRFLDEAQVGAQLQHPGVVPVYDIGRFGERPFFTMKLVKGQTLAAMLGERTDPATDQPRFLVIMLQVTQTLAYAHSRGVIHRDLKPANVMVGSFGEVQVMDWGLAKVLAEGGGADEERTSREAEQPENVTTIRTSSGSGTAGSCGTDTEAGSVIGTPAYMPPEQANGEVALLDRRADVFGLGAILCEILTGKPPYVGRSSEEVRRKACNGDLADALARLDKCVAEAELIAQTKSCLSPEATDRPKDAQAVADGLSAYLNNVQERLHQAELAEAQAKAKAAEEVKRRRLTLALAATVLLALTMGGAGWLSVRADRVARQAQVAEEVNDALNKATALREQAKGPPGGGAVRLGQAREQAQRALALVENGSADAALTTQVRRLQAELDDDGKDRKLLDALDRARVAKTDLDQTMHGFSLLAAVPLYREALREYGLSAGEGEPAAVAARIRQRPAPLKETLGSILEDWIGLAEAPNLRFTEPRLDWLRAVAAAIEPAEGWIKEFRNAQAVQDPAKRRASLEKLAGEADVTKLPAQVLMRLSNRLGEVQAHDSAILLLRRAVKAYPADVWINHNLGFVALTFPGQRKAEEALRYLSAAVALRPDSAPMRVNQGNALLYLGRYDDAIACFRQAIELEPRVPDAHRNLGIVLKDRYQIDEGIACMRDAVEVDPKFALGWADLGIALAGTGHLDESLACLNKALAIDPQLALTHTGFGILYRHTGQLDQALVSLQKALECDPNFALAHYNRGTVHEAKGQLDTALGCYQKAVEVEPREYRAYVGQGHVYLKLGRPQEGLAAARKAVEINPWDAYAHNCLGFALEDTGKLEEAIAEHRKAVGIAPKLATCHMNLGIALKDAGRFDEAIACHNKAIELDPKFPLTHYNLGVALAACFRFDEAVVSYKKTIQIDPRYANAYIAMGTALAEAGGDLDEAIVFFKKALEINPRTKYAYVNLGSALLDKRRLDEAIEQFRKEVELDPNDPGAQAALGNGLMEKADYQAARTTLDRGLQLLPQGHPERAEFTRQLQDCERFLKLGARLERMLSGQDKPASAQEALDLATICYHSQKHFSAVRFFNNALAANRTFADDLKARHRQHAACSAAMALAGRTDDAGPTDEKERSRLCQEAVNWLRGDLRLHTHLLASNSPADRAQCVRALTYWQQDPALAGIRAAAPLAKLSSEDRAACESLWADVAASLKKAETSPKVERKP